MIKRPDFWPIILAPLLIINACTLAKVNVDVVSERTALENQVIGTMNSLDAQMLSVASVRGVDPAGRLREPPQRSADAKDTLKAMQVIEFNADDVGGFKKLGWVGEDNKGYLAKFPLDKTKIPEDQKIFAARFTQAELDSIVDEVNKAREALMLRVVDLNESFSRKDLPKIMEVFAKLNADSALPGEKVQLADGTWITR